MRTRLAVRGLGGQVVLAERGSAAELYQRDLLPAVTSRRAYNRLCVVLDHVRFELLATPVTALLGHPGPTA